ncbi:MAG: hypothetical protein PHY48_12865 [Candidatus Cloacimonetes bacterium]|jgi:hypothetical protein|nr:hypothetical protein [Candidatus Cloacimonadota bacterium]
MICVDYILAAFTDIDLKAFEIPKLRGYFAYKYPDNSLFHNHLQRKVSYEDPKIQYRIYEGHPALIGIGERYDV